MKIFSTTMCAVLLPLGVLAQSDIEKIQNAPWFEREIAEGVTWKTYHFDDLFSSAQDIHVTLVDMDVEGTALKFPHRTGGTRLPVSTFAGDFGNTAAVINGNFFSPQGEVVQFFRVDGVLITGTWPEVQDEGAVIITDEGFADTVLRPGSGNWADRTEPNVMASNIPLMSDGSHYPHFQNIPFYTVDRHPRSAVGKTADNKLMFVAVDGRRPDAAGMTMVELRTLLEALGAHNALNLDGGGSTAMWVKGEPSNGIVNKPSGGSERPVPSSLAIIAPPAEVALEYDSRFLSVSSYENTMEGGETQTITMTFRNHGTAAWGADTVLRTTEPRDNESVFYTDGEWLSPSSPGGLNQTSVAPGANGSFTFTITAPEVTEIAEFRASFGIYDGTGGWLGQEQNRISITVLPEGGLEGDIIVESRTGGQNTAWYADSSLAGEWADNATSADVPGVTPGIGMRYASTYTSIVGSKRAQFRPTLNAGTYRVYVVWGAAGLRRASITYIVNHADGQDSMLLDQTQNANQWILLGEYAFEAGNSGYVEVNNSATDVSGSMYTAAARWVPVVQEPEPSASAWMMH